MSERGFFVSGTNHHRTDKKAQLFKIFGTKMAHLLSAKMA
jgi:hypothetical protein